MRVLSCLVIAILLSGCLPIGIRGSTMPFQGPGAADGRSPIGSTRAYSDMGTAH